jgi:DNA-binding Lrp family transcriptional regulator
MLTSITPREAPAKGPTTSLDHAICAVLLGGGELEPREIQEHVLATLPQIYARLRVLVERGVIRRVVVPGSPRRGPGAGRYCKA